MHRTTLSLSLILALAGLSVSGCAQAPVEELEQAEAALADARASEAERYAPEAFNAGEDTLMKARAELSTQAEKFPLVRSYDEASRLLTEAKISFAEAEQASAEAREEARVKATDALARADALLAEASAAVETMPAKVKQASGEEMKAVLKDAVAALDSARADLKNGDYLAALTKADGAQSRLNWVIDGTKGDKTT